MGDVKTIKNPYISTKSTKFRTWNVVHRIMIGDTITFKQIGNFYDGEIAKYVTRLLNEELKRILEKE